MTLSQNSSFTGADNPENKTAEAWQKKQKDENENENELSLSKAEYYEKQLYPRWRKQL